MASYDLKAILGEKLRRLTDKTLKALVDCMCTVGASLCSLDKRVSALESVELPEGGYKPMQEPVASPSASGTAIQFIESVSQDATGRMTATKKTVRTGSTSQTGVLQLTDSHSSTSTTTAATPKNVKEAYDLANTANTGAVELGAQLQMLAEDIDRDKVSRKAYQSSDFSDWNEFETTGVYEICGQVSGVQNSPESGRVTLYVTKSTTASTGRFFVTQLAVGNHVYRRTKAYKRTESDVDIYEWSSWSIIDGDVTYTLSGSSDVGFNEMKDVFAKTGNIAVLVGEAIGNYTYLERFPLTDVEYSNGSISEFVFSRSRPHDDGTPSTAGTVDYYKLSSSGWISGSYTVGYARKAGSFNMSASEGSDVRPVYFTAGGAPSVCGARFPYLVDSSGNYSSTQIKMCVGNTLGTDSNALYFV